MSALSLSCGPLTQAFQPATFAYGVTLRGPSGVVVPASPLTTTVTASVSRPGETLTLAGAPLASGVPSAPLTLAFGSNPLELIVTAPDRQTQSRYTVDVSVRDHDYIKASVPATQAVFGWKVALSNETLAVAANVAKGGSVAGRRGGQRRC